MLLYKSSTDAKVFPYFDGLRGAEKSLEVSHFECLMGPIAQSPADRNRKVRGIWLESGESPSHACMALLDPHRPRRIWEPNAVELQLYQNLLQFAPDGAWKRRWSGLYRRRNYQDDLADLRGRTYVAYESPDERSPDVGVRRLVRLRRNKTKK